MNDGTTPIEDILGEVQATHGRSEPMTSSEKPKKKTPSAKKKSIESQYDKYLNMAIMGTIGAIIGYLVFEHDFSIAFLSSFIPGLTIDVEEKEIENTKDGGMKAVKVTKKKTTTKGKIAKVVVFVVAFVLMQLILGM